MITKERDVFAADIYRRELAASMKLEDLRQTYSGDYPELGDISTSEKWDSLSGMESVPEVRIKRLEKAARLIDADKKILDIGVGWGEILPMLLKENKAADYTGIDFSAEVIKRLSAKYPGQKFLNVTVDKLNEKYDYILVLEVLEHIVPSRVFDFLNEARRLLKDDGVLIVSVPLEDLKNNTFVCGKCGSFVNKMGHVRNYSVELIKAELQLAGFKSFYSELLYHGYYGLSGTIKRMLRNAAGYLAGPSGFKPLAPCNVILALKQDGS
ncbi:MAG: class I SAM-dependent methyltransferase [Nitrospirae bacterium]|nr:class I SAM-dependent methyltransferase [Nitrospirota bacterium]